MEKISDRIVSVGVNDTDKVLFEGLWPLPYGVSYNSYLVMDEKVALIDTVEHGFEDEFIENIDAAIGDGKIDYLVVNHMEPDHSSLVGYMLDKYPGLKIVANAKTVPMLKGYYETPEDRIEVVADGGEISLGSCTMKFFMVPMVHWPETMVTYEVSSQTLFSCDAFGGFGTLDGGIYDTNNDFEGFYLSEMRRYYSNIVGKYSNMVQKALAKLQGLPIKMIAPSHGLIWNNPGKVVELYDKWSRYEAEKGVVIIYASMYGNTAQMADYIGNLIGSTGMPVRTYDVSKTHVSHLLNEIWKYKGVILGTCAYNTKMHPMMEHLCNEIDLSQPKGKKVALFGTSSWNGAGAKALKKFVEEYDGFELVAPVAETFGSVSPEKVDEAIAELAKTMVESL